MDFAERKITEALHMYELAKNKYHEEIEISQKQRDPAVIDKLRFEMDVALKHLVDSTNEIDFGSAP